MFDFIAIGNLTFDIFNVIHEARLREVPREHASLLEVTYGDKIPVDRFAVALGGNATNTAVGLSRLGFSTALYAVRGDDMFGKFIKEELARQQVDDRYVMVTRDSDSNVSTVLVYKRDRTIFPYYVPRTYALPKLQPTRWVYLSAGGEGSEKLCAPVQKFVREHKAKLAFNPGSYQLRHARDTITSFLPSLDVLLVNREEGEMLLGAHHGDMVGVAKALKRQGPHVVVVTDDVRGATAVSDAHALRIACFKGEVVEKTGAGDAFTAGFLGVLSKTGSIGEGLRAGAINAASVVQYIGAQEGLLMESKLNALREKHSNFVPRSVG